MTYKDILNDPSIVNTYNNINIKLNYVIDHGMTHINHVIDNVIKICNVINVDDHTKDMALIAATLHDIGRIEDNDTHPKLSADFCKVYLDGKMSKRDIDYIAQAVSMHGSKDFNFNTNNKVAWILLLADKLDVSYSRLIKKLITYDAKKKPHYYVDSVTLSVTDNTLNYNIQHL